jgi:hypothetical protein
MDAGNGEGYEKINERCRLSPYENDDPLARLVCTAGFP